MLDAVRTRRSIRRYQDRPIEPADLEQLKEAVLRAPSSRNLQPWHFVFVTDRELLGALALAKPSYGEYIGGAPLGVAICADPTVSDCWIEDCSIATTILQLVATDLGVGSCWIQIRGRKHKRLGGSAEAYVRDVLGLSKKLSVLCLVSLGYPAEEKEPRSAESLPWDKVETR